MSHDERARVRPQLMLMIWKVITTQPRSNEASSIFDAELGCPLDSRGDCCPGIDLAAGLPTLADKKNESTRKVNRCFSR